MNNFHLFAWDTYYPGGGLADYVGSRSSLEAIEQLIHETQKYDHYQAVAENENGSLQEVLRR